jgi:hypothetical protein
MRSPDLRRARAREGAVNEARPRHNRGTRDTPWRSLGSKGRTRRFSSSAYKVRGQLDRFGVTEKIGEDKYFALLDDAFTVANANERRCCHCCHEAQR